MKLSVILITMNEEDFVRACLESVAWADEIIVVDSGSTDTTIDICREYTDRILVTDWPGPGAQRNRAIDMATGDWILALDADEWVSPELKSEILTVISAAGDKVAFAMPRLSSFCGRYIRHSGWWPDRIVRLFKRGEARFNAELIHDHMIVDGKVGRLSGHLMHEAYKDLADVLGKANRYSTDSAQVMFRQGRRASLQTYIIRTGFLDGREGLILAVYNAEVTYYKYLKLMYLKGAEKSKNG
jgi:glycosyltransferase involved in cell wall biosynthesis